MSGADSEGAEGKAELPGENSSSSSSHSNSEPSEFSLSGNRAGSSLEDDSTCPGSRLDQGTGGESGKNQDSPNQQLKYYGRRNRAKFGKSHQAVESTRDREDVENSDGTRLVSDSREDSREAGIEERSKLRLDSRNGSSVEFSAGSIGPGRQASPSGSLPHPQGSIESPRSSRGGEEEAVRFSGKYSDTFSAASQRQPEGGADAIPPQEMASSPEFSGPIPVDDRDEKKKNGVVVDLEAVSRGRKALSSPASLKGLLEAQEARRNEGQASAVLIDSPSGRSQAIMRNSGEGDGGGSERSSTFAERKDNEELNQLVSDHQSELPVASVDANEDGTNNALGTDGLRSSGLEQEVERREVADGVPKLPSDHRPLGGESASGTDRSDARHSVYPDITHMKSIKEGHIRKSTTSIVKLISSLRNGDTSRTALARGAAKNRKAKSQALKEEKSQGRNGALVGFTDLGRSAQRKDTQRRPDLERQQYEDLMLARAKEILAKQETIESSKRIPIKGKEPTRAKSHWDFVLEEMVWLSKDFEKERKWKLSQAKKVAVRVSRSKLDVEAKGIRRLKEEEQRTRRTASNIAKDVKKFWMKVEKLVMYKHQLNLEERRKKALDKHLDFLLGQTERYSTMLAENLADNVPFPAPKALPSVPLEGLSIAKEAETRSERPDSLSIKSASTLEDAGGGLDVGDDDFDMEKEAVEEDDETTIAIDEALVTEDERREELSMLQRESEVPIEELLRLYKTGAGGSAVSDDSSDDGSGFNDSDSEDSEDSESEIEDARGNSDGDISLETSVKEREGGSARRVEDRYIRRLRVVCHCVICVIRLLSLVASSKRLGGEEASKSHVTSAAQIVKSSVVPFQLGRDADSEQIAPEKGTKAFEAAPPESAGAASKAVTSFVGKDAFLSHAQVLIDDGDYIPATLADGIEEDDEATLDEEDRLADGESADPSAEVDALQRESEMSVEELLAQYKAMAAADQSEEDEDEDEDDNVSADRQDRTSEAETSSSSDEDMDHEEPDEHNDQRESKQTIEMAGESSKVGGEQSSLVPSGSGRDFQDFGDRKLQIDSNGDRPHLGVVNVDNRSQKHDSANVGDVEERGADENKVPRAKAGYSSLLQAGDITDAETLSALAKVSEAAKRRGERMRKRSCDDQEPHPAPNPGQSPGSAEGKGPLNDDGFEIEHGDLSDIAPDVETKSVEVGKALSPEVGGEQGQIGDLHGTVEDDPVLSGAEKAPRTVSKLDPETVDGRSGKDRLADAAAEAQSAQPTGYTFLTAKVRTKLPFLLKHSLREYQHIGLDWLVTMYEKRLNGILADEMGLGKTIMTISLLAHLACDRGIWGPHLIVVPTSVMLNWETEFMKWCPAFKILTYFGSAKERKYKRQGWSKQNSFHVCITTYRLVIQDAKAFRRKKWKYLILDEAHLIKNWKSQRWQTLLNFNSKRRILLTGTPLQNDLMELWSLMHFLMPHVFQSHQEFRDWFSNPITGMVEGQEQVNKEVIDRLHNVLRPFLLRRLKQDVEKQLPQKFEHVIRCRLSKRQRNLYEDFMANSDTQATLASGNFLGLINVLMQLRKVCNHPDLFEGRPITSAFDMSGLDLHFSSLVCSALQTGPFSAVDLGELNLLFSDLSLEMTAWECEEIDAISTPPTLIEELSSTGEDSWASAAGSSHSDKARGLIEELQATLKAKRSKERKEKLRFFAGLNMLRCTKRPLYGSDLRNCVSVENRVHDVHKIKSDTRRFLEFSSVVADMVKLPLTRLEMVLDLVESFVFAIPAARAPKPSGWCSHPTFSNATDVTVKGNALKDASSCLAPLRPVFVRRQLFFPDRRLLQFDCGKLQELSLLLRRLRSEGHRALIFTQMTKMLDILEGFISLYGYTYMRLDGSTKPEQRQILMQRFNTNPKIFLFILSTRSGGVGINLVGADTVIFYDSDWNPAMDQQAQDRCHRIGQTREVHIYRLVSESTIEENILKKANQKRVLDDLVIQSGSYNTEFFKKLDPMELFSGMRGVKPVEGNKVSAGSASQREAVQGADHELSNAEVEAALKNAEDEADYMAMKRVEQEEAAENQEFTEEAFTTIPEEEDGDELEEGKIAPVISQVDLVKGSSKGVAPELGNKETVIEEVHPVGTRAALVTADAEEEMDMLADVKQMAAAAAASGRGSMSFEDQLRPVERYAMRFLELWDPRVDKASEAAQVLFEEKEWELDQLEKLKEEQEAEIDEDNEPLFYESWDTAFANEAYRQQVEVLAQQQEYQRQLEWEAMEEEMQDAERTSIDVFDGADRLNSKPGSSKKLKKTKFKSLKKGPLAAEEGRGQKDSIYGESVDEMPSAPSRSPSLRKRKAPRLLDEEMGSEEYAKRLKIRSLGEKNMHLKRLGDLDQSDEVSDDDTWSEALDPESGDARAKSPSSASGRSKFGGKVSITMVLPPKKGVITLEKERKKDAAKMHELVPTADPWTPAEDGVLCAVVQQYGGNWPLASDVLAGMPDGSNYRGRSRHAVHCRERYRQLLGLHVSMTSGDPSNGKSAQTAVGNGPVRVTEEQMKKLLDIVIQLPDNEFLLQHHLGAIVIAVRNMLVRGTTSITRSVVDADLGPSPQSEDFVTLTTLVELPCTPVLPSSEKTSDVSAASPDVKFLLREALKNAEDTDGVDERLLDVGEEILPNVAEDTSSKSLEDNAEEGTRLPNAEMNLSEIVDLNAWPAPPTAGTLEDTPDKDYTRFMVSVRPPFNLVPPVPSVSFENALRTNAEKSADQRFRVATTNGWGDGIYGWAASASSALGSFGVSKKEKSKKRPHAPESSKPPKPKQPRLSKVRKDEVDESPKGATDKAKNRKNVDSESSGGALGSASPRGKSERVVQRKEPAETPDSPPPKANAKHSGGESGKKSKVSVDGKSKGTKTKKGVSESIPPTESTAPKSKDGKKSKKASQSTAPKGPSDNKSGKKKQSKAQLDENVSVKRTQVIADARDDTADNAGSDDVVVTGVRLPSEPDSEKDRAKSPASDEYDSREEEWAEVPTRLDVAGHHRSSEIGVSPGQPLTSRADHPARESSGSLGTRKALEEADVEVIRSVPDPAAALPGKVSSSPRRRKGTTWVPPAEMIAQSSGALAGSSLRLQSAKRLLAEVSKISPGKPGIGLPYGNRPDHDKSQAVRPDLPGPKVPVPVLHSSSQNSDQTQTGSVSAHGKPGLQGSVGDGHSEFARGQDASSHPVDGGQAQHGSRDGSQGGDSRAAAS